jgi:hypothetical protein
MRLYNVIGIVASVDGGRLNRKAGMALLWSLAKHFHLPFSEGAFRGNFLVHSFRPLATSLYADGGALSNREDNSEIQWSDSKDSSEN